MLTIVEIEIAACEGGGVRFVVCEDFDVSKDLETFDTLEEAEGFLNDL